jgi:hypothetical protein
MFSFLSYVISAIGSGKFLQTLSLATVVARPRRKPVIQWFDARTLTGEDIPHTW